MDERKNQTQLSRGLPRGPKGGQGPRAPGVQAATTPKKLLLGGPCLLALAIWSYSWAPEVHSAHSLADRRPLEPGLLCPSSLLAPGAPSC